MPAERVKRKLAAILSADVAGYSLLMVDDEVATVSTLTAYRQVMTDLIVQHRGRVVDSPGDNLLAEFPSVVDAMQCAVAVQKDLKAKSIEMPDHRKMEFRIGINLGDVIEEGDRIYGDGVNIAARLEALSEPGGICISRTAYDQIEDKLPLGYEYLGEKKIKNSPKPLRAYRVLLDPDDTTFKGKKEKRTEVHEEKEEQPAAILKNAAREFADRAGDALKVAAARPVGESVPLSPEAAAGKLRYAGFWIRSAAAFIDIVIVGVISQVLRLEGAMALLLILYNGFLIGLWNGQTIGKKACRIKVINADGHTCTLSRAFARALAGILSILTLFIGYFMLVFDSQKRALHDRIAETLHVYVIR